MSRILFKYATRNRPELFDRGMRSILDNVASDDFQILVSVDNDDKNHYDQYLHTTIIRDNSLNKVDAINRDIYLINRWDILVNMSDDMVFTVKGFDDIIRKEFANDITAHCLHFPDGNRNDLITMSIISREFYTRFGYIYNPEYKSLYCDNEQTEVSKILGCYKFINQQIFEHLHPAYGKAHFDAQYQHTESFGYEDSQTFLRRQKINYGL